MTNTDNIQINRDGEDTHKHLSCDQIEEISKWEKFKSVIAYFWSDRRPAIITVLLIIFCALIFLIISDKYKFQELLTDYFETKQLLSTFIQLTTFFAILSIWYRTIRKEWRQKLNKFITVSFTYDNELRIRCRYAKLSSEADARGMAQSFAQILNCGRLDFAPSLQEITETIKADKNKNIDGDCCYLINGGKPLLHYDVVIHLIKDIPVLCKNEENEIELKEGHFLQWDYPFAEGRKKQEPLK